jgi:Zn-dependent protease
VENVKSSLFLLAALVPALLVREYAKATVAGRLGDPTPKRWGRLTLNPKQLADPFGTYILPALILLLWASGAAFRPPPFAYAKPMPLDPSYLKHRERDSTWIALAGPLSNLTMAAVAGVILRAGFTGDVYQLVLAFLYVNLIMFVFHLMPIPGLDGARILARFLPPRAREVYTNLDQYLVLFMLLIFFLLGGPLLSIVDGLTRGACNVLAGAGTCL